MLKIDVQVGQVFGRLIVVAELSGAKRRSFFLRCLCGGFTKSTLSNLRSSQVNSCGCLRKDALRGRKRTFQVSESRCKAISTSERRAKSKKIFLTYLGSTVPISTASALSGVPRATLMYRHKGGLVESTGLFKPTKRASRADKKPSEPLKEKKSGFGLKEPTGFFKAEKVALKAATGYWSF